MTRVQSISASPDTNLTEYSDADLLRIILDDDERTSSSTVSTLLKRYPTLRKLSQSNISHLNNTQGINKLHMLKIKAMLEITHRLTIQQESETDVIRCASDAVKLVPDMFNLSQEEVRVILLNTNQQVMAIKTIYIGTVNTSVIRNAEIFREALLSNSPAIILIHNHPFGLPNPSPQDIELTQVLISAGNMLDIMLVDHIIIGQHTWASLKEMGLCFY